MIRPSRKISGRTYFKQNQESWKSIVPDPFLELLNIINRNDQLLLLIYPNKVGVKGPPPCKKLSALDNRLLGTRSETTYSYSKAMPWPVTGLNWLINSSLPNWRHAKYELRKKSKTVLVFYIEKNIFSHWMPFKHLMSHLNANTIRSYIFRLIAWSAKYSKQIWSCVLRQIYFSWMKYEMKI